MSTETVRIIRDGELAQDVHLDFHTAPDLCKSVDVYAVIYDAGVDVYAVLYDAGVDAYAVI